MQKHFFLLGGEGNKECLLLDGVPTYPLPSRGPQLIRLGKDIRSANWWTECLPNPCCLEGPQLFTSGKETRSAHLWADAYITPAVSGVPNPSERGGKSGVPICGRSGYITPAF